MSRLPSRLQTIEIANRELPKEKIREVAAALSEAEKAEANMNACSNNETCKKQAILNHKTKLNACVIAINALLKAIAEKRALTAVVASAEAAVAKERAEVIVRAFTMMNPLHSNKVENDNVEMALKTWIVAVQKAAAAARAKAATAEEEAAAGRAAEAAAEAAAAVATAGTADEEVAAARAAARAAKAVAEAAAARADAAAARAAARADAAAAEAEADAAAAKVEVGIYLPKLSNYDTQYQLESAVTKDDIMRVGHILKNSIYQLQKITNKSHGMSRSSRSSRHGTRQSRRYRSNRHRTRGRRSRRYTTTPP